MENGEIIHHMPYLSKWMSKWWVIFFSKLLSAKAISISVTDKVHTSTEEACEIIHLAKLPLFVFTIENAATKIHHGLFGRVCEIPFDWMHLLSPGIALTIDKYIIIYKPERELQTQVFVEINVPCISGYMIDFCKLENWHYPPYWVFLFI